LLLLLFPLFVNLQKAGAVALIDVILVVLREHFFLELLSILSLVIIILNVFSSGIHPQRSAGDVSNTLA